MNKPSSTSRSRHINMHKHDIFGQRFSRLVVVARMGTNKNRKAVWLCECDCGKCITAITSELRNGHIRSCGCLRREMASRLKYSHGQSNNKLHKVWSSMKTRCLNQNQDNYYRYGGRGISVCAEWLNFEPFMRWAMQSGYEEGLSLERNDVNLGYSPENCRWIPLQDQSLNTCRTRRYTYCGETLSIKEWSVRYGIAYSALFYRINNGWPIERALLEKSRKKV